jgi:hypothetical protein
MRAYLWIGAASLIGLFDADCRPQPRRNDPPLTVDRLAEAAPAEGSAAVAPSPPPGEARILRFAWRPAGGTAAAYEMSESADQHQIVLTDRVARGGRYPVLIALHGQPKRAEHPRNYSFPRTVADVAEELVHQGAVAPLVLALPVFRFLGTNWPAFDLVEFRKVLEDRLAREGIHASGFYVVGHSGAAGCGGDGLNRAHRIDPKGVGFFDTCLGAGWREEVQTLRRAKVPTLLIHSVETAGVVPRQAREYLSTFDFGQVYAIAGLHPVDCTEPLPDVPLRPRSFRCTADVAGVAHGFIIDTGEGEAAHEAVVPVALSYFLRRYLPSAAADGGVAAERR